MAQETNLYETNLYENGVYPSLTGGVVPLIDGTHEIRFPAAGMNSNWERPEIEDWMSQNDIPCLSVRNVILITDESFGRSAFWLVRTNEYTQAMLLYLRFCDGVNL